MANTFNRVRPSPISGVGSSRFFCRCSLETTEESRSSNTRTLFFISTQYSLSPKMPMLNFLNRQAGGDNNSSTDDKQVAAAAADATRKQRQEDEALLPSPASRRYFRDCVLQASAVAYIRLAVNTSLDLEEDRDLSKGSKVKKRQGQQSAHQAYKDRMKAVLGNQNLQPILSTCLLLDESEKPSEPSTMSVSPQEAFACISLLLCNYILLTASGTGDTKRGSNGGFDARIRNVLRMASIQLLAQVYEAEDEDGSMITRLKEQREAKTSLPTMPMDEVSADVEDTSSDQVGSQLAELFEKQNLNQEEKKDDDEEEEDFKDDVAGVNTSVYDNLYRRLATRKFEALEQSVTDRIMKQMSVDKSKISKDEQSSAAGNESTQQGDRFSRKSLVRAAKIGGVGVAAGALFAVTGGLAAPAIGAGLAALGVGGTALTLAASPAALIALFGVGGGGLSAYKMKRRTDGLSEFCIHHHEPSKSNGDDNTRAHLHTTVCVSGWLKNEQDFQRPWGVEPLNLDERERLLRFFAVVDPAKMEDVDELLKPYASNKSVDAEKKEELWNSFMDALKDQYGKSPDELFPLEDRQMMLSSDEESTLRQIIDIIAQRGGVLRPSSDDGSLGTTSKTQDPTLMRRRSIAEEAKATVRVWDQQSEYGGDIYTIQWESKMLLEMCRVADAIIKDLATKATKEVLKQTALATLMAATAWPSLLLGIAGSLDNNWTLITLRSDIAGVELAKSLLLSDEHRPVQLVGFSFGARIIYACLQELARHQAIWEEQQGQPDNRKMPTLKMGKRNSPNDEDDSITYTREPASIVQGVILMGAPLYVSRSKLRLARHMVAGRFINCFSRKDWILSLMFQYKNTNGILRGTCGTGPIKGVGNIENFDVASLVGSWHAHYCDMVPDILDLVGFDQPMPTEDYSK